MEAKRAADDGVEPAPGAPAPDSSGETMGAPARAAEPQPTLAGRSGVSPLAVLGVVLLTATLAVSGFLGWQIYGTTWLAQGAAAQSVAELRASWDAATPSATPSPDSPEDPQLPVPTLPAPGKPAWILRIPSQDVEWPIVSGVETELLKAAVGWYPSTALPGQVGNAALAGLRITHGEPFGRVLELAEGDEVIIETAQAVYTYRITLPPSQLTVHRDESWVLDPVPGKPDLAPTEAILTLTTHEDLIDTPDRAVGFGVLENTEPT
ncbi:class E sortase [Tessaracoccus sp. Z1128]